jgi:hypothetical protein
VLQVDPFHCSMPLVPPATQNEVEVHETPARVAAGLGTTLQVVPFHCSMTLPTATQNEVEVQEMPERLAAGLGTTAQVAGEAAATVGLRAARAPNVTVPAKATSETTATESRLVARACFGLRPVSIINFPPSAIGPGFRFRREPPTASAYAAAPASYVGELLERTPVFPKWSS